MHDWYPGELDWEIKSIITERSRLEDDGCPHHPPIVNEEPTSGVSASPSVYNEAADGLWRLFSCGRCGWYVWHPISYCHKCGGRMRKLIGKSSDLRSHVKKNNFEDGGF